MKIEAVLFDIDGVLCDACEIHRTALNDALAPFGFTITMDEHIDRYNGKPTKTKLRMLTEEKDLDPRWWSAIEEAKQEHTCRAFCGLCPDQEKISLLSALKRFGLKVAVCSNSIRRSVEIMMENLGLTPYLDLMVSNEDVAKAKPDPEMYLYAAETLGVCISRCAIVEDSPVGIEAALAANPGKLIRVEGPHRVNMTLLEVLE